MNRFMRKNKMGLALMILGVVLFSLGIYREEHLTVAKKSNIICLECIGIG